LCKRAVSSPVTKENNLVTRDGAAMILDENMRDSSETCEHGS